MIQKTNFHMLRELNFKPRNFGILTGDEVDYLRDYFQLEERSDLDLQNLRDFVVMCFAKEDSLEKQDIMSGLIGVIDLEKTNRGMEV